MWYALFGPVFIVPAPNQVILSPELHLRYLHSFCIKICPFVITSNYCCCHCYIKSIQCHPLILDSAPFPHSSNSTPLKLTDTQFCKVRAQHISWSHVHPVSVILAFLLFLFHTLLHFVTFHHLHHTTSSWHSP